MKADTNSKSEKQLYRGIFWAADTDNLKGSAIAFHIPCDKSGCVCEGFVIEKEICSENSNDYNHKKLWSTLSKRITQNKPYNYYPRGRIEIRNGKALIFASVHLPADKLLDWARSEFNLSKENGITKIKVIADGSQHYKCYLD